jgi:membrane associated rhomboid family serine protease
MVMPLYDDNPFKLPQTPVVSWSLIGANIMVFLLEMGADRPAQVVQKFGLIPAAVIGEVNVPGGLTPILTLVTYQFLHADIVHVIGNLIFLWVYGDNVEQALGRWRFLAFYLLVGVIAALAFVWSTPHSTVPLIGASGSIAGVVIAYLMLRPCAKITALVFGIPLRISAYWIIGVFIFIQFINLGAASKSEVAWWCHIGGMAAGAALLPLMKLPGVRLFECIQPDQTQLGIDPPIPETASLPGAPPVGTPR